MTSPASDLLPTDEGCLPCPRCGSERLGHTCRPALAPPACDAPEEAAEKLAATIHGIRTTLDGSGEDFLMTRVELTGLLSTLRKIAALRALDATQPGKVK